MIKYLLALLFLSGVAFSQVTEEEQAKIVLADYVIELNKAVKLNAGLTESINALVAELQAIKEPSEELIAVLKKYNIYKENNGNVPGEN